MKAFVVHSPGKASIEEVDPPSPQANQVVVEIARAGVCGTDVEFFNGDMAYFKTGEAQYPMRQVATDDIGFAIYQLDLSK